MSKIKLYSIVLLILLVGLSACVVPTPSPADTPTVTPIPTDTPTPEPTNTPTKTPTPTDTPTPTETPIPPCLTPVLNVPNQQDWEFKVRIANGNGCYQEYHCEQYRIELYDAEWFSYDKAPRVVLNDCMEGDEIVVDSGILFVDINLHDNTKDWMTPMPDSTDFIHIPLSTQEP